VRRRPCWHTFGGTGESFRRRRLLFPRNRDRRSRPAPQARAPSYRLLGLALVRGISTTTYDHTSSQDPCPAVSPNDALLPRSLHNGPSLLPQLSLLQSALRVGIAPHPHSTLPRPNVHRPRCLWPRRAQLADCKQPFLAVVAFRSSAARRGRSPSARSNAETLLQMRPHLCAGPARGA